LHFKGFKGVKIKISQKQMYQKTKQDKLQNACLDFCDTFLQALKDIQIKEGW
jgi:hypothetical protein